MSLLSAFAANKLTNINYSPLEEKTQKKKATGTAQLHLQSFTDILLFKLLLTND